jgi:hypothetical protein
LKVFRRSWTELAREKQCIKMKDNKLVSFFKSMTVPLGMTEEDLKDDNEIHKNIVQMDIRADEEGYVYFNELLYKVMKKTYGVKHIRNLKLAEYEGITFIKINKIQEKASNYLIREDKKATAVNPFLAIMYYNISFKTWINLARKKLEIEALNDNIGGSEQSNDDFSDIMQDPDEKSNESEGSFHTFRVESVASSSANFGDKSGDSSSSQISEFGAIEEHSDSDELDNPDGSFDDKIKGKRLFEDYSNKTPPPINTNIQETDERKDDDVYSDGAKKKESKGHMGYFDEKDKEDNLDKKKFDSRKRSAPESIPFELPRIENGSDHLNIIEENKHEQTFSIDKEDMTPHQR